MSEGVRAQETEAVREALFCAQLQRMIIRIAVRRGKGVADHSRRDAVKRHAWSGSSRARHGLIVVVVYIQTPSQVAEKERLKHDVPLRQLVFHAEIELLRISVPVIGRYREKTADGIVRHRRE